MPHTWQHRVFISIKEYTATAEQVKRRCHIHCSTKCSATTETQRVYAFGRSQHYEFLHIRLFLHCTVRRFQDIRAVSYGVDFIPCKKSLTITLHSQDLFATSIAQAPRLRNTFLMFSNITSFSSLPYEQEGSKEMPDLF